MTVPVNSCVNDSSRYCLSISENEVFFDPTLVGNISSSFELTLENIGWEDVLIQSISVNGPFTLVRTNCPDILKPQQVGRITVSFVPTSYGPWTGSIFIEAGYAGNHNVRLIGAAYNSNQNGNDLSGIPIFLTRADLEDSANLVYPNGSYALVVSDEALVNNDFYRKTGNSGEGNWGEPLGKLSTVIINGQIDLENLDNVINGAANLVNPGHPAGTVTLRNGETYKTLANILGLQTTQQEIATAQAVLSQKWAEGTLPAGPGTKSAKEHSIAAEEARVNAEESASFAEEFSGPSFANVAAGEAATTTGQFFRVWNGDTPRTYTRYERTAGGSAVAAPLATTSALAATGGSGMVGFSAGGASPATRTAQAKMRDARNTADKSGNLGVQLTSWKTDLGAAAGGVISIPAGNHTVSSEFNVTNGYDLQGDGRIKTVIDPAFAGTVFKFGGADGVTAYHNRASGLGFFTTNASNHTLFHVRNGANTEISRMSMPVGGVPGAGSIGILHEGREITWYHDNILAIAKPLRIIPNPDSLALNITTDYMVNEREHYIATVATEACVEATGAYLSNAVWRDCALVKGAEGIKLVNNTTAAASHNISITGCRREQAETASAYSFHFDFTTYNLQNLHFGTNYTSSAQNGFYGRDIKRALLHSSVFTQGVGRTAIDYTIPTAGTLTMIECQGQVGGTKTITNGHPVLVVPSRVSGDPIGSFEHWSAFVTPTDPGAGGTYNYDSLPPLHVGGIETAAFEITVPTGSRYIRLPLLPANTAGADAVGAEVFARSKTGRIHLFYPADGSVPTTISASGIFATTATANRIYGYASGIISNTLAESEVIRVEVRK